MATSFLPPLQQEDQPITQTDMLAPSASPSVPASNESDFVGLPSAPQQPQAAKGILDEPITTMKERIAKYDLAANDSRAKTIAILAAVFAKNFGPLLQIEEQRRRTKVANALMPEAVAINELTAQGKWEEASKRSVELATAAGGRVPELKDFYNDINKRIVAKQQDFQNMKNMYDNLKLMITNPDDPRQPMLKMLGNAVKQQTPMSEAMLNQFYQQSQLKTQRIDNMMTYTSEATGKTASETVPVAARPSQFENLAGYTVGTMFKLGPNDLTNIVNNQPVPGFEPGSTKAAEVKKEYNGMQKVMMSTEINRLTPMDPTQILALREAGVSWEDIALRNFTVSQTKEGLNKYYARREKEAEAPVLAGLNKNPVLLKQAGYVPLMIDPEHPEFMSETPPMTYSEVQATGGRVIPIRQEIIDKEIKPAIKALSGLNYVDIMFKERADPNAMFPGLTAATAKLIGDYTNIPVNSSITIAKAAETVVRRAVEQLAETGSIDAKEVGVLKNMITSAFANPENAAAATEFMKKRIKETLARAVGNKAVLEKDISDKVKNESIGGQGMPAIQQTPNGPVVPMVAPTKGAPAHLKGLKIK